MIVKVGRGKRGKHRKSGKTQINDIDSFIKILKMARRPFRGSEMSVLLMTGGSSILGNQIPH
jgi:hypothetical protein